MRGGGAGRCVCDSCCDCGCGRCCDCAPVLVCGLHPPGLLLGLACRLPLGARSAVFPGFRRAVRWVEMRHELDCLVGALDDGRASADVAVLMGGGDAGSRNLSVAPSCRTVWLAACAQTAAPAGRQCTLTSPHGACMAVPHANPHSLTQPNADMRCIAEVVLLRDMLLALV